MSTPLPAIAIAAAAEAIDTMWPHEISDEAEIRRIAIAVLEAAAPLITNSDWIFATRITAARTEAAAAEREYIRQRLFTCTTCGEIHQRRDVPRREEWEPGFTWAHHADGHAYHPRWQNTLAVSRAEFDALLAEAAP